MRPNLRASESLRTIDPHDKEDDEDALRRARQWVSEAGVLYIFGFGFDASNCRRVGLDRALRERKAVMLTNFGNVNTVNKRASNLLFGKMWPFTEMPVHGDPTEKYSEKSERNVYEAIEKDFNALEWE
jgi:hypothetical protein